MPSKPRAYKKSPPTSTGREPCRSAHMPVKGCARPHSRFCKAMAKPKSSRDQPRSRVMGNRKMPCAWRTPSDKPMIKPADKTRGQRLEELGDESG